MAADIGDKGILMTGGGALLYGIDKLISKKTGIDVRIAENPHWSCSYRDWKGFGLDTSIGR